MRWILGALRLTTVNHRAEIGQVNQRIIGDPLVVEAIKKLNLADNVRVHCDPWM